MTEDEKMDASLERVLFLKSVGLDPAASIAIQLASVRLLLRKLKAHEAELEQWARSGGFNLAVSGESVSVVIKDGAVMVVHSSEPR